jgi:hypothetical protein
MQLQEEQVNRVGREQQAMKQDAGGAQQEYNQSATERKNVVSTQGLQWYIRAHYHQCGAG